MTKQDKIKQLELNFKDLMESIDEYCKAEKSTEYKGYMWNVGVGRFSKTTINNKIKALRSLLNNFDIGAK